MVVVITSSERTPFARMSRGPLPLALGCPATRQGSPWMRFPKEDANSHDLPIRYPQRYPGRGFAP
jgi:hypothetical protein